MAILYGLLKIGAVPGTNSITNSISWSGGIPGSSSGKTSGNSETVLIDQCRGHCFAVAVALLLMLPEVLVSHMPRPQSRMVPPPEVSRVVVTAEAAHPLALAIQWADFQCISWLCGEYGPSKIWK